MTNFGSSSFSDSATGWSSAGNQGFPGAAAPSAPNSALGASVPNSALGASAPGAAPAAPTRVPNSTIYLITALIAAIAAVICVLFAWFGTPNAQSSTFLGFAVAGWFMAGIISVVLSGIYQLTDAQRQALSPYIPSTAHLNIQRGTIILAVIAVLVAACEIALYFAKL